MAVGRSQFVIALWCALGVVLGGTAGPTARPTFCNVFKGTPMQRHMGLKISRDDDWDEGPRCARCISRNLSSCSAAQFFRDTCDPRTDAYRDVDDIGCDGGIDDDPLCPAGIRPTSNPYTCCFLINRCACPDKETAERHCDTGIGMAGTPFELVTDQQVSWTNVWQIELRKVTVKPVVTLFSAQSALLMLHFLDAHPNLERYLQYADKFAKSLDQLVLAVNMIQSLFSSEDREGPLNQLLATFEDVIDHRWEDEFKQVLRFFDRKTSTRHALGYFNDTALSRFINSVPDIFYDIKHCAHNALKVIKVTALLDRISIHRGVVRHESSKVTEKFIEGAQHRQERFDELFSVKDHSISLRSAAARAKILRSTIEELAHMESSASLVDFLFEVEEIASYVKIVETDPCGCCTMVGSAPIKQLGNYFHVGSYIPTWYGWIEYGKLGRAIAEKVDRIKSSTRCLAENPEDERSEMELSWVDVVAVLVWWLIICCSPFIWCCTEPHRDHEVDSQVYHSMS